MRAWQYLAPVAALALVGGCSGEGADREMSPVEEAIVERMAEAPGDDATAGETDAARNELVAACMAESGLEYLGPPEAPSLIEWLGLTEDQFRDAYGFGHSTTIDLAKAHEAFTLGEMEQYQASFANLSAAEREQYTTREQECLQEAYAAFGLPENGTVNLPSDSPINDYIEQVMEATMNDPRLADATAAWSACMNGQGYDFADRDHMGLPLAEDAQPFIAYYAEQGQALVDAGRSWDDLHVADVLDADQLDALDELEQRELATAAAHQRCIDQGNDIDAIYAEVHDEHMAGLTVS